MDCVVFILCCVSFLADYVTGQLNKYEFNPWQDRDCFDCTYTNQAPDGKRIKIVFEDMIDIVDNNYKCDDPWYGRDDTIKTCPSNRCMKIYQRWHDQELMMRRCETPSNACVPKEEWSPEYHVHVQCCDNKDDWPHRSTECNVASRQRFELIGAILLAKFAMMFK